MPKQTFESLHLRDKMCVSQYKARQYNTRPSFEVSLGYGKGRKCHGYS